MTRLAGTILMMVFSAFLIPVGTKAIIELLAMVGWWRRRK